MSDSVSSPSGGTLADFTSPALVIPQLGHDTVSGVIQELGALLGNENRLPDLPRFLRTVLAREEYGSTNMEAEMAFPHARMPGVETLSFAMGRFPKAVRWGDDGRKVRIVFLMVVPGDDSMQHLSFISGLARLSGNTALLKALYAAPDGPAMIDVLRNVPLRRAG
jgi:mannitol/fructose-specific phosphotransferase system IIA component (Ntr-type)